jgi:TonB family protein
MFDQLTESNTATQNEAHGRRGYFVVTSLIVGALFLSGVVWSLYGKDIVLGAGDMELSEMVSPVAPPENAPRPPEQRRERQQTADNNVSQTTRQTNMLRVDETHLIPDGVSTTPNTSKARTSNFVFDPKALETTGGSSNAGSGRKQPGSETEPSSECQDCGIADQHIPDPPPIKKDEPKKVRTISQGVINGTAIDLPKPQYPAAAKAIGASGAVNVQVMIDESGVVTSAKAVSGHPLLRQNAEKAARGARFKPTLLSHEPVKVTGVIVYNFTR